MRAAGVGKFTGGGKLIERRCVDVIQADKPALGGEVFCSSQANAVCGARDKNSFHVNMLLLRISGCCIDVLGLVLKCFDQKTLLRFFRGSLGDFAQHLDEIRDTVAIQLFLAGMKDSPHIETCAVGRHYRADNVPLSRGQSLGYFQPVDIHVDDGIDLSR